MMIKFFNIGFFVFLFEIYDVNPLKVAKTMRIPHFSLIQQGTNEVSSRSSGVCRDYSDAADIKKIVSEKMSTSSFYPNRRYFLFFLSKPLIIIVENSTSLTEMIDLGSEINLLFPNVIDITFYCQSKDSKNFSKSRVIGLQNTTLIESKKLERITYEYLQYLLNTFNLKTLFNDYVARTNKTLPFMRNNYTSFLQKASGLNETMNNLKTKSKKLKESTLIEVKMQLREKSTKPKGDEADNRISRLMWSLLIVLVVSLSIFFLVKYSVDWATSSKTEINKQKDQRLREIAEALTSKTSVLETS